MLWNWQQEDWPHFNYDKESLKEIEELWLHESGILLGAFQHLKDEIKSTLIVDLISNEALKTSAIEGEYLSRDSLQSSIRRSFGLEISSQQIPLAEQGIAEMMVDLYRSFSKPLTHQVLFSWHKMLTKGRKDLKDLGKYRTHEEPMQIVSGYVHNPKVHFEAPASKDVMFEMNQFVAWFNKTSPDGQSPLSILTRAGITHLYFVSIHPFEDGNGRIARALAEKSLSQSLGQPTLIALSHTIEKHKKLYYQMLEQSNKNNEITRWLVYFAKTVLEAQAYTKKRVEFLIEKAKLYDKFRGKLNPRQEKVLARMFREGLSGFKGGLSAENYISITGVSRATTTRDLQDLVAKGALVKIGEFRYTRYYLNIQTDSDL